MFTGCAAAFAMVASSVSVVGLLFVHSAAGAVAFVCTFSGISVAGLFWHFFIRYTLMLAFLLCSAWNALNVINTEYVWAVLKTFF